MIRTYSNVHTPYDYTDAFNTLQRADNEIAEDFNNAIKWAGLLAKENCPKIEDKLGTLQELLDIAKKESQKLIMDMYEIIARESCD